MSSGIIDLRPGKSAKKPPAGQQRLFSSRAVREPEMPKRPLPLRARRRRVRIFIAIGVLVVVALAVYGVSWLSYRPQFSIQSVNVVGTQNVSPQLVQQYVETVLDDGSYHLLSRDNIFLYPRAVIEKAVASYFPRIKSAVVSRDSLMATAITVSVEERQSFALWCADAAHLKCYQMDSSGFIFAEVSATSSGQYIFGGGLPGRDIVTSGNPIGETFVGAHLPGLLALLKQLGQSGFTAQGAEVQSDQDFWVPLANGFFIKASFGEDANQLAKNLQLVLSSDALQGKQDELEYVDLRFGDRVYYKFIGKAEATGSPQ